MAVELTITTGPLPRTGTLVVFAAPDGSLSDAARELERTSPGIVARALQLLGDRPKHGAVAHLPFPAGLELDHLFVAVCGKPEGVTRLDLERLGAELVKQLEGARLHEAQVAPPGGLASGVAETEAIAALATGAGLRAYRFTRYRERRGEEEPPAVERLRFLGGSDPDRGALERATALVETVNWVRDLVSEPGNVLYPGRFAEICRELERFGIEVEVFDAQALEELGMRALLAVGQGSSHPPFLVVMRWRGAEQDAPLALVGKGVCFDSGGISIKPAQGMQDMKWDMAGAAVVCGAIRAAAVRRAPVDLVAAVGLAENMPSGTAQRPGDVIRAYTGKTIEVVNTDAEGRLLLADVLGYVCERFRPRAVIDLATLTGAVIVALGHERAGLFANDEDLAQAIAAAAEAVGEPVWRLPLGEEYEKHIRSDIADIKNVGRGREAGSIAGAVFLQQFVGDRPWAHLDIAGVAWSSRDLPLSRKGATGFGVRLLDRLLAERFERH